ncbi:hypothetical protein FHR51_000386 [Xanthomonas arboricola]|uniref:hypothetical protein n=1 Tax=Xanthomonas cannabis TaxID=1885674 RepID=UPI001616ED8A|nr:hypothetical protein [Xanthomonas cannabis]MBB3804275.1 hypothetical protein [Xanthomonas cannabis]
MGDGQKKANDSDLDVIREYWGTYGGWVSLIRSPYLAMAMLMTAVAYKVWMASDWWQMPQAILPNMLGFSLAGYAIFLSFGSDSFRGFLSKVEVGGSSAFVKLTTTFMHFVMLQIVALLYSLVAGFLAKILVPVDFPLAFLLPVLQMLFWAIGFMLFCYALTSTLASVIAIFRVVRWFDVYSRKK